MNKKQTLKTNAVKFIFAIFITLLVIIQTSDIYAAFSGPITNWGIEVEDSYIALGDIDNDGDLDLIVTGRDNGGTRRLDKYINDGSGNFTGPITNWGIGVVSGSITLGDIDMDSDLDLIVTGLDNGGTRRLDKYINDGFGNFTGPITNWGIGIYYCPSISLGDIDNDGDLDLIVTGRDTVGIYRLDKYINDGNGNFSGPIIGWGIGVYCASISLGDIDNDGDLDLIVTGRDNGGTSHLDKYLNDGSGNFTGPINFGTGVYFSSISLGNIDKDGDLDLIISGSDAGGTNGRLDKYLNNGSGSFTGPTTNWGIKIGYGNGCSIALGDINNDGNLDLVVSGNDAGANGRLEYYINDGSGNFTGPITNWGIGISDSSIVLGDIDKDGDLDLIVTGETPASVYRLDKYINTNTIINNSPPAPAGLNAEDVGGFWRFKWNAANDTETSPNLMQYKIAIGENQSEKYDYISDAMDYPRGQANIGNIPQGWISGTECLYQSKIPTSKTVYWKAASIDTCFKFNWSTEQITLPPEGEPPVLSDIVLVPNPYNPNKSLKNYITFFNCPDDVTIKIYDILGDKIKELASPNAEHKIIWDVKDSGGRSLARGMYMAILKNSQGKKRTIKFLIHR